MGTGDVLVAAAAVLALLALWRLVWRPRSVARAFARQGIRGPPYRFLAGSLPEVKRLAVASRRGAPPLDVASHDIMPLLLPAFHGWVADYGKPRESHGYNFLACCIMIIMPFLHVLSFAPLHNKTQSHIPLTKIEAYTNECTLFSISSTKLMARDLSEIKRCVRLCSSCPIYVLLYVKEKKGNGDIITKLY